MVTHYSIYLLLYTAVNLCIAVNEADVNTTEKKIELCSTVNNKQGRCVAIRECESLYNLLKLRPISDKNVLYLKKSQCGFLGSEPKVCCAFNNEENPSLPVVVIPTKVEIAPKPGNVFPGLDVCGMFVDDRLIYGKGTQLGSFPWLALLEYQKPRGAGFHCGGVLISSRYVLTAAHCVSWKDMPENWDLISVRLGEHNTTSDPDCINVVCYTDCGPPVLNVPIEETIVHEKYDLNDINQYNDIALVRLARPIYFSEFVSPICLPPSHDEGLGMLPFAIAGWGTNKHFEGYSVKQDAVLSMKSKTECQSSYGDLQISITDDQVCAARSGDSKNTCNGDSGGGLMSVNPQYSLMGNYFVVGVMSFGHNNCSSREPTVYTKVRSYIGWIVRNMKP